MLHLSKKIMFAIEAVGGIAYHSSGLPVQSQEITRRQGIPRRYLEHSLQQLVKANVLMGIRGPKGGYSLARERRRISVGDIVRTVRSFETDDDLQRRPTNSELSEKVIAPTWRELQASIMGQLDKITVDDLCTQANERGVQSEGRHNLDFTI